MTTPPGHGPGTGPYGPPPGQQPSGHLSGPHPGQQGRQPPPGWSPPPEQGGYAPEGGYASEGTYTPESKGVVGALFDVNFNHLVTPKLIKVFYMLALLLVSISALIVVAIGIWIAQLRNGWLLGLLVIVSSPVIWLFEAILVRIFMEAVMVRFKGVEHLNAIKNKL